MPRHQPYYLAFSALTLLVGWQERHPASKKTEWWGAALVVCLKQGADFAYGPADATATHSLASVKSRLVYLSSTGSPGWSRHLLAVTVLFCENACTDWVHKCHFCICDIWALVIFLLRLMK